MCEKSLVNPDQDIAGGNKLMAKFMGNSEHPIQWDIQGSYHKSWDWLIPVVEKVRDLMDKYYDETNIDVQDIYFTFDNVSFIHDDMDGMFIELYNGCVTFIKWYYNIKK